MMNYLEKFYKLYRPYQKQFLQYKDAGKRSRKTKISNIKILAIMILRYLNGAGNFKAFYTLDVPKVFRKIQKYFVVYAFARASFTGFVLIYSI